MKSIEVNKLLTFLIATVWLVNGIYYKILNQVPRHEAIVSSILGTDYSRILTILIGISEIIMGIWVLSKFKSRWNAIAQIVIVLVMNILEFFLVPDLLMWGKMNLVFALLFLLVVYFNEFVLNKKLNQQI